MGVQQGLPKERKFPLSLAILIRRPQNACYIRANEALNGITQLSVITSLSRSCREVL